jgi:demethylmenaquinone methyltransferase/2-methoxy-6-polyprenyl-1,4-benzoquinol methylase
MDNKKIFNGMAQNYINEWDDSIKEKTNIKKIIKLSQLKKGITVIEPGCGKGDFSIYILNKIGEKGFLYSIDIAEKMIKYAKEKLKKYNNVKIINCDAKNIKLKSEIADRIICFNCFPHFYPKEKYIKEFYRLLKKDGYLIICHSISRKKINLLHKNFGFDMKKHHLPSINEIKKLIKIHNLKIVNAIDKEFYFVKIKKN